MIDATIIGGAAISAFFSVLFDRVATRQFLELFERHGLDYTLVGRLKTMMMTAHAMLNDAEEMQFTNSLVKKWIDELKDVIYDVEDLVDEINYVGLAESRDSNWWWNKKSTENFKGRFEEMILKFENIVKYKDVFYFKESFRERTCSRIPTTPLVDESKMYGREKDKVAILDFLLANLENEKEIPVIAITGMIGIGKTSLAQLLYNDSSVVGHFAKRVWVYVSENFDVLKVCKTVLESVTSEDCNITDLSLIQDRLKKTLAKDNLLLVLDDVWNENFNKWDALTNILTNILTVDAVKRSRIIVTTRNQGVASTTRAVLIHSLPWLSDHDCWLIFTTYAFGSDNHRHPNLKQIGEKVTEKCQGLPLVAKVLGSLFYSKVDVNEWRAILDSNIWDLPSDNSDLFSSLALSYCYLPHDLKQCFTYCSVFPKGYVFNREKLVLLWKAEGFLPSRSYKTMEEVGNEYFEVLLSRSLFKLVRCNDKSCFMMHDLIYELAQFVSGEYHYCKLSKDAAGGISTRARRFSYVMECFDSAIGGTGPWFEAKCLRTFLPLNSSASYSTHDINEEVVKHLVEEKRQLRVLSLLTYNINKVPYNFSKSILLKYLDFSYTPIKTLPDSIGVLYYLETFILSSCYKLIELPTSMKNLINLGYLDLRETRSLKSMPPEIGKLENLLILTNFVVGSCGSKIDELGKLLRIQNKLSISELQNVMDTIDAENANMKDKKDLKELVLSWNKTVVHDEIKETIVFEKLQPHGNIDRLSVEGYHGKKFPDWLGDSTFTMKFLYFDDCKNCSLLPSLGNLSSLQELYIEGIESLRYVGPEFYGNGPCSVAPFRSLCIMKLVNLPNWETWASSEVNSEQFPSLQELHLQNCNKLLSRVPRLPLLEKLYIKECSKLNFTVRHYPSLQILDIQSSCDSLRKFKLKIFSKLKSLTIRDCKNLKKIVVPEDANWKLEFIEQLKISDCPNLKLISADGLPAPNLSKFFVSNCNRLMSMPKQMHDLLTSLRQLGISGCPKLQAFSDGGLPANLQSFSGCLEDA